MALTNIQREVCHLIARQRISSGESYVAENATEIVALLPYQNVGQCVLHGGELFRGDGASLRQALARGEIRFHAGTIRGAFPQIT